MRFRFARLRWRFTPALLEIRPIPSTGWSEIAALHLTASSEFRSLKIPLSQKTFVMSPDFMSLGLIVVVLLGVLLTILPVSQGSAARFDE